MGVLRLRTPKTRNDHDDGGRPFYPKRLEQGVSSERAMTLAVTEMHVQGVGTRNVVQIVEGLCERSRDSRAGGLGPDRCESSSGSGNRKAIR